MHIGKKIQTLKYNQMRILFKTNLDKYQTNCFPENLKYKPCVGEKIHVTNVFVQYYRDQKLPIRLEVVDVTHTDQDVVCELWYCKIDVEAAKLSGVNLF